MIYADSKRSFMTMETKFWDCFLLVIFQNTVEKIHICSLLGITHIRARIILVKPKLKKIKNPGGL